MPRPDRTPIGLTLARTSKTVARAFDAALTAAGGSTPVWLILLAVKTRDLENQRELAERVGIQGATLTHHLSTMEAEGLLTRERDPANRRVQHVQLTKAGETLFRKLANAAQEHDKRLRRGLGDDDLSRLEHLLGVLAANVSDP